MLACTLRGRLKKTLRSYLVYMKLLKHIFIYLNINLGLKICSRPLIDNCNLKHHIFFKKKFNKLYLSLII